MRSLPLTVRFEVPARHHADAGGVVSIARAHLDAVPDCLLSVAAQQSPADQVVRLSAWPEPNLAVFKVVMCRLLVGCMQQSCSASAAAVATDRQEDDILYLVGGSYLPFTSCEMWIMGTA